MVNIRNLLNKKAAIREKDRLKAATALNLCTASISRIIDSHSVDIMELEYDAILNNLNLQNIIKDEALLATMRTILDTISFYRVQAGDRKRIDARYQHKINNALWDAFGKINYVMVGSGAWAAAAAAIIQIGSAYCSVRRNKSGALLERDDERWQLERSAIEQLHALRCSLFETAWRLADTYKFADEWRLTVKQIDHYNAVLMESDPKWRYAKLMQLQEDFCAYPYYWYELSEAAFQVSLRVPEEKNAFLKYAEEALEHFMQNDMQLLRQDLINASARLRYAQLLHEKNGSWAKAVTTVDKMPNGGLRSLKRLAYDSPDILLNAAVCYAAAYEEAKNEQHAAAAVEFLEILVNQKYNCPMTSRLLSGLYLTLGKTTEYKLLAKRFEGVAGALVGEDGSLRCILSSDRDVLLKECALLLEQQFLIALKLSFPEIYNFSSEDEINEHFRRMLREQSNTMEDAVKDELMDFWGKLKEELNSQMVIFSQALVIEPAEIGKVALDINNKVHNKVGEYSGVFSVKNITNIGKEISRENRALKKFSIFNSLVILVKEMFRNELCSLIVKERSGKEFLDIAGLETSINELRGRLSQLVEKNGLVGLAGGKLPESINFFEMELSKCSRIIKHDDVNPTEIETLIKNNETFEITNIPLRKLCNMADIVQRNIKHLEKKVRVCIYGNNVIMVAALRLSVVSSSVAVVDTMHKLLTFDPDYEVVCYPNKLRVQYMRISNPKHQVP